MDQKNMTDDELYLEVLTMYLKLSDKGKQDIKRLAPDMADFFEMVDAKLQELTNK